MCNEKEDHERHERTEQLKRALREQVVKQWGSPPEAFKKRCEELGQDLPPQKPYPGQLLHSDYRNIAAEVAFSRGFEEGFKQGFDKGYLVGHDKGWDEGVTRANELAYEASEEDDE